MPYVSADTSLPRSLDVQISLSRPQAETRTIMDIPCVAAEDLGFYPNENRIRFYSSIEALETDFASGTEVNFAGQNFFDQTPRPQTMAVGEVFMEDQPAILASAMVVGDIDAPLIAIVDGSMDITYNPGDGAVVSNLTLMDFSTPAATLQDIVDILNTAIGADPLTASLKTLPGGTQQINITTDGVGVGTGDEVVTITYPIVAGGGTFVGDLLKMTAAEGGIVMNGYVFIDIGDELSSVQAAAQAQDKFIYGWCLGATLRDTAIQITAAAWALSRTAIMPLVSNDPLAVDIAYELDLGFLLEAEGANRRVFPIYHDNSQSYPDMSILAYMLSVNYQLQDSTATAKFKQLPGISTVSINETEWGVLQSKGYNTYTAIGNNAETYRDGTGAASGWFMDTVINLDNFIEDLTVNVFNVFLRNKKVPYTRKGQALLTDPCTSTGAQYEYNGTFADREVADTSKASGIRIDPAVLVEPSPIANTTAAQRATRQGPPIAMTVQEAGAIHTIAISVEVVS